MTYGKQLYWTLLGYMKGYMLISTGVVGKGDNVDKSTLTDALGKAGKVLEFAEAIPVIGEFAELISNFCNLFVDMETDTICQKVYEIISYNYNLEEDLNDAVCESVLLCLNSHQKLDKVRQ